MPNEAAPEKQSHTPPREPVAASSESLEAELAALEAMLPPVKAPRTGKSKTAPVVEKEAG